MTLQFKKINNESGVVLFFVLMTAIIIMIFSVGILMQSSNEVNYAQQQIDQIASEQLAKGAFWKAYSAGAVGVGTTVPLNGRNYQVTQAAAGSTYTTTVTYDTF